MFGSHRQGSTGDLWAIDVASGRIRRLTSGVAQISGACIGRDGRILMNDFSHQTDLYLQDLASGEARRLTMNTASNSDISVLVSPQSEIAVAADGSALTFLAAKSHFNMNLHLLRLKEGPDGLPRADGDPVKLTAGDGQWHVHNGGFTPDGKSVVYTRDTDTANIYMLEGAFPGIAKAGAPRRP